MNAQENVIPFQDLAKLNEHGEMVKLVAAPLAIVFGALILIVVLRFLQRMKEQHAMKRYMQD